MTHDSPPTSNKRQGIAAVLTSSPHARWLIASNLLAVFGDSVLILVLALWVKNLTGSNGQSAGVFVALGVPALLSLLGGKMIDRLPPRIALLSANCVSVAALASLFLVNGRADVWVIYAASAAYAIGTYLYQAARSATAFRVVSAEHRPQLITLLRSSRQAVTIIAPSLGTLLYVSVSPRAVVALAIGALAVSSLLALPITLRAVTPEQKSGTLSELGAGVRHIGATKPLLKLTIALMAHLAVAGYFQIAVIATLGEIHASAGLLGPVSTVQGLGALGAAALVPRIIRKLGDIRTAALGIGVEAIGALALGYASMPSLLLASLVFGVGLPILLVGNDTAIMNRSPSHLQGRASLAVDVMTSVPLTLSFATAGALIGVIGATSLMFVMAGVTVVAAVLALKAADPEKAKASSGNREPGPDESAASAEAAAGTTTRP